MAARITLSRAKAFRGSPAFIPIASLRPSLHHARHLPRARSSPCAFRCLSTIPQPEQQEEPTALPGELFSTEALVSGDASGGALGAAVAHADAVTLPAGVDLNLYTLVTSPASFVMATCDAIQSASGMPWWLTISAYAVGVRMLFFPMLLGQKRSARRMRNAKPELSTLQERITQLKNDPRATPEQISETGQKLRVSEGGM